MTGLRADSGQIHYTKEGSMDAESGWYEPVCVCGAKFGVFPDAEVAADALMQHAYERGYIDAGNLYRGPRRA